MNRRPCTIFILSTFFLSVLSLNLFANQIDECCSEYCSGRFAIQAAIATGGNVGIGLVHYTENTEFGVTAAGQINNARFSTKVVTPVIFGGLRHSLCDGTYLAYGLNFANTFGKLNGERIKYALSGGPYISLEQMLTHHVMLVVWINPYQYGYQKIGRHSSVTTQSFFSAGGIGLNYLF